MIYSLNHHTSELHAPFLNQSSRLIVALKPKTKLSSRSLRSQIADAIKKKTSNRIYGNLGVTRKNQHVQAIQADTNQRIDEQDCQPYMTKAILCWRKDLAFFNLRWYLLNLIRALRLCWFAVKNHKRILIVNDSNPLLQEQQADLLKKACHLENLTSMEANDFSSFPKKRFKPCRDDLSFSTNQSALPVSPTMTFQSEQPLRMTELYRGLQTKTCDGNQTKYHNGSKFRTFNFFENVKDVQGQMLGKAFLKNKDMNAWRRMNERNLKSLQLRKDQTAKFVEPVYNLEDLLNILNVKKTSSWAMNKLMKSKSHFWNQTNQHGLPFQHEFFKKKDCQGSDLINLLDNKTDRLACVETHSLEHKPNQISISLTQSLSHNHFSHQRKSTPSASTVPLPQKSLIFSSKSLGYTLQSLSRQPMIFVNPQKLGGFFSNSKVAYNTVFNYVDSLTGLITHELKDGAGVKKSMIGKNLEISSLEPLTGSTMKCTNLLSDFVVAKKYLANQNTTLDSILESDQTLSRGLTAQNRFNESVKNSKLLKQQNLYAESDAYRRVLTHCAISDQEQIAKNPWLKQVDLVFFIHPENTRTLVNQIKRLRLPTVGLVSGLLESRTGRGVDQSGAMHSVNYPIVGNPNSIFFVRSILSILISVIRKARDISIPTRITHQLKQLD